VGRTTMSLTSMCSGAPRHHRIAEATSAGCKHLNWLVARRAASSSPYARTYKTAVKCKQPITQLLTIMADGGALTGLPPSMQVCE
jgi:hypothetical protein